MGPDAQPRAGGRCGSGGGPLPQRPLPVRRRRRRRGAHNVLGALPARPTPRGSSLRADPGAAPLCSPTRLHFPAGAGRLPSDHTEPLTCEHAGCHFSTFSTMKAARGGSVLPGGRFSPAPPRRRPPLLPLPRPGSARGIASHRHFPASRSSWEVSDLLSALKEEELLGGALHFSLLPFYWLLDDFYSLSLIQEETAESLGELHY
ncbi:uncharacterized protein [Vicugna pacos]|uniref:Uncharacterized protein n=1 Tax=Vicugna pacos TaxID=30538 RepID=A0ABM5DDP9_VICPA